MCELDFEIDWDLGGLTDLDLPNEGALPYKNVLLGDLSSNSYLLELKVPEAFTSSSILQLIFYMLNSIELWILDILSVKRFSSFYICSFNFFSISTFELFSLFVTSIDYFFHKIGLNN